MELLANTRVRKSELHLCVKLSKRTPIFYYICVVNMRDFFPLLDCRGMLWLETEGGKDAKGAFLNVFFQEREVTLRNVT